MEKILKEESPLLRKDWEVKKNDRLNLWTPNEAPLAKIDDFYIGNEESPITLDVSLSSYPDGDQILFYLDWGDGVDSGWIGPFDSGEICETSHKCTEKGSYEICVWTKDVKDALSYQSETLFVSMPKNKILYRLPLIDRFFENHPHLFPLLRQILRL